MQSDTKSFILRVWAEGNTGDENPSTWRGVVEQVGSPKRLYFQDLGRAFKFVHEQTGFGMNMKSNSWRQSIVERINYAIHLRWHKKDNAPEESDRN